jgi:hypothetical protein
LRLSRCCPYTQNKRHQLKFDNGGAVSTHKQRRSARISGGIFVALHFSKPSLASPRRDHSRRLMRIDSEVLYPDEPSGRFR